MLGGVDVGSEAGGSRGLCCGWVGVTERQVGVAICWGIAGGATGVGWKNTAVGWQKEEPPARVLPGVEFREKRLPEAGDGEEFMGRTCPVPVPFPRRNPLLRTLPASGYCWAMTFWMVLREGFCVRR